MGYDGARGLGRMKRKGATTLGQDETSCVVYGMPKAAFELGAVQKQVSLEHMGHHIMKMLR
jgi:two-component system chemotaxis response regulator CheB